ncbi:DUF1553 domain-containing protein [bacterium]|nr:DUF1553 domain-containing protein [bacterium]
MKDRRLSFAKLGSMVLGKLLRPIRYLSPLACVLLFSAALMGDESQVDFARDVQPILAQHCYQCHGPDAQARKADLRWDDKSSAMRQVTPGQPRESELYRRLISSDPDVRMPPSTAEHQPSLTEIATIRRWIEQGAPWKQHWSLLPMHAPALPEVKLKDWPRGEIDFFTLAQMEAHGATPAEPASKYAWLRRVTFDLTGLPPTKQEIERYLADQSPHADKKVIQRLLASPSYGEHFAREWFDLARYADTHGYTIDSHRDMWRYREWVIDALNDNMPFDQFTIEQLAGDLLPNPTIEQLTATGFHRNVPVMDEDGVIAEEYRHAYVIDRVNTTGTVWLGMTLACAQCHDHKFDPISQRDFYQLAAYFDNIDEKGTDGRSSNAIPVIKSPTKTQQKQSHDLQQKLATIESEIEGLVTSIQPREMARWESDARREGRDAVVAETNLLANLDCGQLPLEHEAVALEGDALLVDGKVGQALVGNGDVCFRLKIDLPKAISVSAWLYPTIDRRQTLYEYDSADGNRIELSQTGSSFTLAITKPDNVTTSYTAMANAWETNAWHHLAFAIDLQKPQDARLWIGGQRLNWSEPKTENVANDLLMATTTEPGQRLLAARGLIDEVRIDSRIWSDEEAAILAGSDPMAKLLAIPPKQRSEEDVAKLKAYYLRATNPEFSRLEVSRAKTNRQIEHLQSQFPETMVMRERDEPRVSHIRVRGAWDQLGEEVQPGLPMQLFNVVPEEKPNRLQLAHWLVDKRNPLTARVVVNRYWQHYFGTGLVETVGDFGTRGALPSHPKLLDYLASELIASGWDVKYLQQLIVSSNTYRQSSYVGRDAYDVDPQNLLLARGPRLRLSAEEIRDQALAASGLLRSEIGGPSVSPYQPPGLWKEISKGEGFSAERYVQDHGNRLYRRSLYTYWKRSCPPPSMRAFDAPNREVCIAQRSRTNTPMQALVLLNDVTFIEAAKVLANDVLQKYGDDREAAIREAFLRVVSRPIEQDELALLLPLYRKQETKFANDQRAMEYFLREGETEVTPSPELAAMTVVCQTILNLDEAVTSP